MELSEIKEVYYIRDLTTIFPLKILRTSNFIGLENFNNKNIYTCYFPEEDGIEQSVYLTFNEAKETAIYYLERHVDDLRLGINRSEEKLELLKELKECQK
jgi:hypothetical protein